MRGERDKAWREASRYHTLAIEMPIALIMPTLLGLWLDSRTGREPLFLIIGMVLGAAAAARSAHRTISESYKEELKEKEEASGGKRSE